jgi:hypothetical protein
VFEKLGLALIHLYIPIHFWHINCTMTSYLIDDVCAILANISATYGFLYFLFNYPVLSAPVTYYSGVSKKDDLFQSNGKYTMISGKRSVISYFIIQCYAVTCFAALSSMAGFPRLGRNDAQIGMLDSAVTWRQSTHIVALVFGILSTAMSLVIATGFQNDVILEAFTASNNFLKSAKVAPDA